MTAANAGPFLSWAETRRIAALFREALQGRKQKEVARLPGWSESRLHEVLRAVRRMRPSDVLALAGVLGVDVNDLEFEGEAL